MGLAARSSLNAEGHPSPVNPHFATSFESNDGVRQLAGKHLARLVAGRPTEFRRVTWLAMISKADIRALVNVARQRQQWLMSGDPRVHRLRPDVFAAAERAQLKIRRWRVAHEHSALHRDARLYERVQMFLQSWA